MTPNELWHKKKRADYVVVTAAAMTATIKRSRSVPNHALNDMDRGS